MNKQNCIAVLIAEVLFILRQLGGWKLESLTDLCNV